MSYTWEGMKKILYEEARERYLQNKEVYLLYYDDSESLVEEDGIERIDEHWKYGEEFGYHLSEDKAMS